MSVKPTGQRTWRSEKKEAHQTQQLVVDDKPSDDYNSRKRKDRETYPPLPCKDENSMLFSTQCLLTLQSNPSSPTKSLPERKKVILGTAVIICLPLMKTPCQNEEERR
ncbi:unnamed protein product [Prunus brigantina]